MTKNASPAITQAMSEQEIEQEPKGRRDRHAPVFRQDPNEEGALTNKTLERYVLMIVDDIPRAEAWRQLGKKNAGGSFEYKKRCEAHPPFIARVAQLLAEKEELMADEVFGEAKWMARQMWRQARATENAAMMQKAADMRMKILEKETSMGDRSGPAEGVVTQGRPGRKSIDNPQATGAMDTVRQRLIDVGVPTPGSQPPPEKELIRVVPATQPSLAPEQPDFMSAMDRAIPA